MVKMRTSYLKGYDRFLDCLKSKIKFQSIQSQRRLYSESNLGIGQNVTEKILQNFSDSQLDRPIQAGDFVYVQPWRVMTHDNTAPVISKFNKLYKKLNVSNPKVFNNQQLMFALDHDVQSLNQANMDKFAKIKQFAQQQGVAFHEAGRGIGHQIMIEEGFAFPQTLAVASDSHSNMYGGIGCLGTPIVRTDACAVWATGRTWFEVPNVTKVNLLGSLAKGVSGKDVIVTLCSLFSKDQVLNTSVEFYTEIAHSLPMDFRLTIANMTTEWGSLSGLFPVDEVTLDYYYKLAKRLEKRDGFKAKIKTQDVEMLENNIFKPDENCSFVREINLDLSTVGQYVSGPNSVKIANPVSELSEIKINKAYLISCTNSRLSDIEDAVSVIKDYAKYHNIALKDIKFSDGVKLYISAASSYVEKEAREKGYWDILVNSGAIPLPSGCGPCIGLGTGLLEKGEVGISSSNRNFKGRMGNRQADCYLASPSVVIASALTGHISKSLFGLETGKIQVPKGDCKDLKRISSKVEDNVESDGKHYSFLTHYKGIPLILPRNDISTDAIYSGRATYDDSITFEQQADLAFENYAPEVQRNLKNKKNSDKIIIVGYNFGTGSSREQAVTSLVSAGVRVVIGGSFNSTYKRNAINNGLLYITCPELINDIITETVLNIQPEEKISDIQSKLSLNNYLAGKNIPTTMVGIPYMGKNRILNSVYDDNNNKIEVDIKKGVINIYNQDALVKSYSIPAIGTTALEILSENGLENWVVKEISNSK